MLFAIALTSGPLAGDGWTAAGIVAFLMLVAWCFAYQRVDRTLAAVALYLGLLDGYLKLRTGSSSITLARDALVFAIAAGALLRALQAKQRLSVPPLGGFVIAFSLVVFIELANPASRGLTAGFAGVRQHLEFVPLFFLGYAFLRRESQIRNALLLLVFCAAAGGVVSYIQSRLSPAQLAGWGAGYAERINGTGAFAGASRVAYLGPTLTIRAVRPFGLGSEIGDGALTAALAFPGLIALFMVGSQRVRWAVAIMAVGLGLAVATSGSRGGQITVVVALGAFGLISAASKNALKAMAGVIVGAAVLYIAFVQLGPTNVSSERAQSITPGNFISTFSTQRGGSVALFGPLVSQHPLGVGVGTVGPASTVGASGGAVYNSETEWNFLVVELGLAGVVIYVGFLLRLMWLSMRRIRHVANPSMRLYLAAIAAPVFGLAVAGFGGPTSASAPGAPYLWFAAGVLSYWLVGARRRGVEAGDAPASDDDPPGSADQHEPRAPTLTLAS